MNHVQEWSANLEGQNRPTYPLARYESPTHDPTCHHQRLLKGGRWLRRMLRADWKKHWASWTGFGDEIVTWTKEKRESRLWAKRGERALLGRSRIASEEPERNWNLARIDLRTVTMSWRVSWKTHGGTKKGLWNKIGWSQSEKRESLQMETIRNTLTRMEVGLTS